MIQIRGIILIGLFLPAAIVAGTIALLGIRQDMRRQKHQLRMRRGLCPFCGYCLHGNQSGICPECGNPHPGAPVVRS